MKAKPCLSRKQNKKYFFCKFFFELLRKTSENQNNTSKKPKTHEKKSGRNAQSTTCDTLSAQSGVIVGRLPKKRWFSSPELYVRVVRDHPVRPFCIQQWAGSSSRLLSRELQSLLGFRPYTFQRVCHISKSHVQYIKILPRAPNMVR